MYDLTVRGSPAEVLAKLLNIRAVVKGRKEEGWKPFQADETWIYFSEQDSRVCPVCKANGARRSYNGTIIQVEFPRNERFIGIRKRLPRVHQHKPWLKGICRCTIEWRDPVGTLETRLGKEMELVSTNLEAFP